MYTHIGIFLRVTILICVFSLLSGFFALEIGALGMPSDSFICNGFFGQNRGNVFSKGLIFAEKNTVRASDSGRILTTLEVPQNMQRFPSTLGNAAVIFHNEGLITTYANLDDVDSLRDRVTVESASVIGMSGNSAWQKQEEGLHFFVADTVKHTAINPLLLLPHFEDTVAPVIKNITAVLPSGTSYALGQTKSLGQGSYYLYGNAADTINAGKNKELSLFYVMITLNGVEVDRIHFETITQKNAQLVLSGVKSFPYLKMYPSADMMLLGSVQLSRGKNVINITARDINGNERFTALTVEVL